MERLNFLSQIYSSLVSRREKPDYITKLPTKVMIKIFGYLSSNQVANCRLVCYKFNSVGKKILNRRFHYFCTNIPKTLCAVAKTNRPDEIEKQCELHLINSGVIMLRAVFGRYLVTGRCCFYPGKILDTLDILYKKTQKRCPYRLSIRLKKFTTYSGALRKFFYQIELAAYHFENRIEPFFPPPKVFIGTKIMDLHTSYCDVQYETNTKTYCEKVASRFPTKLPVPSFQQIRKEIICTNLKWVDENIRQPTMKVCGSNRIPDKINRVRRKTTSSSNTFNRSRRLDVVEENSAEERIEEFIWETN